MLLALSMAAVAIVGKAELVAEHAIRPNITYWAPTQDDPDI